MSTVELPLCATCTVAHSKYCCPACQKRSCSLECVKKHKLADDCSGVRNKTAFIPLNTFTDANLLSDYYFLEEVGRCADSTHRSQRCFIKDNSDSNKQSQTFYWLRKQAIKRGTKVKHLPRGMNKHKTNTSKSVKNKLTKQWIIHWRVHLMFVVCETLYQVESLSEETVLRDILNEYIHPTSSDPIARHKLNSYVIGGGVDGIEVWLKGEVGVSYQLLNIDSTLKDNLKNKTVIEYPTLYVVPKGVWPPTSVVTKGVGLPKMNGESLPECSLKVKQENCTPSPPPTDGCGHDEAMERGVALNNVGVAPTLSSLQLISDMYSESEGEISS